MTLPRLAKLALMFCVSLSRTPWEPESLSRSLPARSIKFRRPVINYNQEVNCQVCYRVWTGLFNNSQTETATIWTTDIKMYKILERLNMAMNVTWTTRSLRMFGVFLQGERCPWWALMPIAQYYNTGNHISVSVTAHRSTVANHEHILVSWQDTSQTSANLQNANEPVHMGPVSYSMRDKQY